MSYKPDVGNLAIQLQRDIDRFSGILPERYYFAWNGYLAALSHYRMVTPGEYEQLLDLMPKIETTDDDPIESILLGPPDEG